MKRLARHILRPFRRLTRREDGSATIEFVILFPLFMFLFLSAFEIGFFLLRQVMLERAVDINVRTLRLGQLDPATPQELKTRICRDALILKDCQSAISVELTPISTTTWNVPTASIQCVDREEQIDPVLQFIPGGRDELMLVRACVVLDPFFATTPLVMNLPVDASGGYRISAVSTFVNEP